MDKRTTWTGEIYTNKMKRLGKGVEESAAKEQGQLNPHPRRASSV